MSIKVNLLEINEERFLVGYINNPKYAALVLAIRP
jgi:hypothetical protein